MLNGRRLLLTSILNGCRPLLTFILNGWRLLLAGILLSELGEIRFLEVKGRKARSPRQVGESLAQVGEEDRGAVDGRAPHSQFFLDRLAEHKHARESDFEVEGKVGILFPRGCFNRQPHGQQLARLIEVAVHSQPIGEALSFGHLPEVPVHMKHNGIKMDLSNVHGKHGCQFLQGRLVITTGQPPPDWLVASKAPGHGH